MNLIKYTDLYLYVLEIFNVYKRKEKDVKHYVNEDENSVIYSNKIK